MKDNERRPNFLIFLTDEMQSASLGCNGNPDVKTPNIDELAGSGRNFNRAYCNNSVCMPSRSTLFTGLTPRQHGCITNGMKLPESVPTITSALVRSGYRTHCAGKIHLQPISAGNKPGAPFSWESRARWEAKEITGLPKMYYGFETTDFTDSHVIPTHGDYRNWLDENHPGLHEKFHRENARRIYQGIDNCWEIDIPEELHYNHWIADRCIDFLNGLGPEENFFLCCSFPDPHFPFATCRPYSKMYDPSGLSLSPTWDKPVDFLPQLQERRLQFGHMDYDEAALRAATAQTYGMISHIDHNVGRVMSALKKKALLKDTVIVFLADHGEYLGSHHLLTKAEWPWEELLRVPYIWRVPDAHRRGEREDDVVSLLDFAPTILDYAGIKQSELDKRGAYGAEPPGLPGRSLKPSLSNGEQLAERPSIIEYDEDWHKGPVYRQRTIVSGKYKLTLFNATGGGIFIDLENDPCELSNLWHSGEHKGIKAELTEQLLRELAKTDPLQNPRISGA